MLKKYYLCKLFCVLFFLTYKFTKNYYTIKIYECAVNKFTFFE